MTTIALALRLLRGGGLPGLARLVLMVAGIAVGVSATLFVGAVPGVLHDRASLSGSRFPRIVTGHESPTFDFVRLEDSWDGHLLVRVLVAADSADAPAPPGTSAFPATGQAWVSPAVADLVIRDDAMRSRIPGTIVGKISPEGLQGPDELFAYIGVSRQSLTDQLSAARGWNGLPQDLSGASQQGPSVGIELALLIMVPAVVYLTVCARLSAATRSRRYAALRLLGVRRKTVLRVAATESAIAGLFGAVLGAGLYLLANPIVAGSGVVGFAWYPERSALSPRWLAIVTVGVALAAAVIGSAGVSRSLNKPLVARFDPIEPRTRWWMVTPFVLGLGLIFEPFLFNNGASGHPQRLIGTAVGMLLVGMVLAFGGLLLALRPVLSAASAWLAASRAPLAVRLAARRLQAAPAAVGRVLIGLVLLVLIGAVGQGLVHDTEIAAGPAVSAHWVTVDGASVPANRRADVHALPALRRWVSIRSVVEPARGVPPTTAADQIRVAGATMLVAPCSELEVLAMAALPGCQNGRTYRLVNTNSPAGLFPVPSGIGLRFRQESGTEVTMPAPDGALTAALPPATPLPTATIVVTSETSPVGWSPDSAFNFMIPPTERDLQRFLSRVATAAPAAKSEVHQRNLDTLEQYRIQRGALTFGVWVGFLLGSLAFVVAMVDRAMERRRDVVTLVVLGTPGASIRLTQLVQFLFPLVLALGLASGVGNLVANALLRADGRQFGWFHGTWALCATLVLVGVVLAGLAALVTPGRRVRAEDLRRE